MLLFVSVENYELISLIRSIDMAFKLIAYRNGRILAVNSGFSFNFFLQCCSNSSYSLSLSLLLLIWNNFLNQREAYTCFFFLLSFVLCKLRDSPCRMFTDFIKPNKSFMHDSQLLLCSFYIHGYMCLPLSIIRYNHQAELPLSCFTSTETIRFTQGLYFKIFLIAQVSSPDVKWRSCSPYLWTLLVVLLKAKESCRYPCNRP
jgi:hypothetical protein